MNNKVCAVTGGSCGLRSFIEVTKSRHYVTKNTHCDKCCDRVVVSTLGIIHDHTSKKPSFDVAPKDIGPWTFCMRTSHATTVWEDNKLHFKLFGGPTAVTRYIEDGVYTWDYPSLGAIKMKRICKVPEHARSFDYSHAL